MKYRRFKRGLDIPLDVDLFCMFDSFCLPLIALIYTLSYVFAILLNGIAPVELYAKLGSSNLYINRFNPSHTL